MVKFEIGRELHDRFTRGQSLSEEEQRTLNQWYDEQDAEEMESVSLERFEIELPDFRRQIDIALEAINHLSLQLKQLIQENARIQTENDRLKIEQQRYLKLILKMFDHEK